MTIKHPNNRNIYINYFLDGLSLESAIQDKKPGMVRAIKEYHIIYSSIMKLGRYPNWSQAKTMSNEIGCSITKILTISKVIYNSGKWVPPIKSLP
jgi:hypothetical protein